MPRERPSPFRRGLRGERSAKHKPRLSSRPERSEEPGPTGREVRNAGLRASRSMDPGQPLRGFREDTDSLVVSQKSPPGEVS
jgi:hypothetical protein